MICRSGPAAPVGQYSGTDTNNPSFSNWSGDVHFNPAMLRKPADLPSLVEVVAEATEQGQSIHPYGSGWAFEDCAKADGVMVSLEKLNKQLNYVVSSAALTDYWQNGLRYGPTGVVHFEAGVVLADLTENLDAVDNALPTLGGSRGQTLGGAISTSVHGGDWTQPPFPDLVHAFHLVTAGGQEVWIESASNPLTRSDHGNAALLAVLPCKGTIVIRDDRVFEAVRVGCGRFGVIYSAVIEVVSQFRLVQVITRPTQDRVLQKLKEGLGTSNLFLNLFLDLSNDPIPEGFEDAQALPGVPYFFQIVFNSKQPSNVWVTRRWVTTSNKPDSAFPAKGSQNALAIAIITTVNAALLAVAGIASGVTAGVAGAVSSIVLGPFGALVAAQYGISTVKAVFDLVNELDNLLIAGTAPFGALIAAAIEAAQEIPGVSYLVPWITEQVTSANIGNNVRGKHYLVTTGARADSFSNDYRSDSIELIFDASKPDYLNFLAEIFPMAPLYDQAGYISLRPSRASSALLSMHNVNGLFAMSIEIASLKNLSGNVAWMSYVQQAAIRHNGRPHWGQENKLDAGTVATMYGRALNDWREALFRISGPSITFSNAFTRQRGLEPIGILRQVTCAMSVGGGVTNLGNSAEYWSPVSVDQAIQDTFRGSVQYYVLQGNTMTLINAVSDGHGGFTLDKASETALLALPRCLYAKKPRVEVGPPVR
jgi:hypothetical protein